MSCTQQEWSDLKQKEIEGKRLARWINGLEERIERLEKRVFPSQPYYTSEIEMIEAEIPSDGRPGGV